MFLPLGELPLITINLGNVHVAFYLSQLMYLLIAALVGFVAEFIVGWRLRTTVARITRVALQHK